MKVTPPPCAPGCCDHSSPLIRKYFPLFWKLLCSVDIDDTTGQPSSVCADAINATIVRATIPAAVPGAETWVTIPGWNPATHSLQAFIDRDVVPDTDQIGLEGVVQGNRIKVEGSPNQVYPNAVLCYLIPVVCP